MACWARSPHTYQVAPAAPISSPSLIKLEPAHSLSALSTWFSHACSTSVACLSRLDSTLTLLTSTLPACPHLLHPISLPFTTLHLNLHTIRHLLFSSLCHSLFPSFCVPLLSQEGSSIVEGKSIRLYRKVVESRGRHCLSTTCLQLLE